MPIRKNILLLLCLGILLESCMNLVDLQPQPTPNVNLSATIVYISDESCPSVEVETGHSIDWVNEGQKVHLVRSALQADGSRLIDSGPLKNGDAIIVKFQQPGTISYECSEDGSLRGTITVTSSSAQTQLLPDLLILGVSLGMQGGPHPGICVTGYGGYEIKVTVQNAGKASAFNISVVETSTGSALQIGELGAGQSTQLSFPLSTAGIYTVGVDMQNTIAEMNESNNMFSYIAPTPTPPLLCTPEATPSTEFPTSKVAPTPSMELFSTAVRSAFYRSADWGEFQLTDGVYYRTPPTSQDSPEIYTTRIREPIFYGDANLDGIQDALVILNTQNGGVGHAMELAVVLNQNGSAYNAATLSLGDRVAVESAVVEDGQIVLSLYVHGPNDGACCPSQLETWTLTLDGNQLLRIS